VAGFGVRPQQKTARRTTTLGVLPVDAEISNVAQSMWIATIDSDIANIQLEEFRTVFAGGISVMFGGLISTALLGTLIDKKDLYADLAVESYMEMADDPDFWRKMSEGMSPEEQEKAKELMEKIKAKRAGEEGVGAAQVLASDGGETGSSNTEATTTPAPVEAAKEEIAKASNDMFSDY